MFRPFWEAMWQRHVASLSGSCSAAWWNWCACNCSETSDQFIEAFINISRENAHSLSRMGERNGAILTGFHRVSVGTIMHGTTRLISRTELRVSRCNERACELILGRRAITSGLIGTEITRRSSFTVFIRYPFARSKRTLAICTKDPFRKIRT